MKQVVCIFMLLSAFTVKAYSQNAKVITGVLAEQQKYTVDAVGKLMEALQQKHLISDPKLIPQAHFYLHRAFYRIAVDAEMEKARPDYPNALFLSKTHLDSAINDLQYGAIWDSVATRDQAYPALMSALYNQGLNLVGKEDHKAALLSFKAAHACDPSHFLTARMLGITHLALKDTTAAIKQFENCLSLSQQPQKGPVEDSRDDAHVLYLAQQLAYIFEAQGEVKDALRILAEGKKRFPARKEILQQQLAIYQTHPELFDEGEPVFLQALNTYPEDNDIRLAFATLLEKKAMPDRAVGLYQEVYQKDSDNLYAQYGIVSYHLNQAFEINRKKMNLTIEDEIDNMNNQIRLHCEKAYPFLVWLHQHEPNEKEWLTQLITISPILGKDQDLGIFEKKLDQLTSRTIKND